jgi:hypothetical protein
VFFEKWGSMGWMEGGGWWERKGWVVLWVELVSRNPDVVMKCHVFYVLLFCLFSLALLAHGIGLVICFVRGRSFCVRAFRGMARLPSGGGMAVNLVL